MDRSKRLAVCAAMLAAGWSSGACAQDAGARLSKSEVESIAVNKKLAYVRDSDQKKIEYDIRDGGTAYYAMTTQAGRNLSIRGSYEVSDSGTLCFKWQQDRFFTLPEACYGFRHDGDKIVVTDRGNKVGEVVK
jgi:hypothetical protein